MKKFSSEKIFKATLATAVAAGAFVAVAPVNTEAASTFSDVRDTPGSDLYEAVMNYTSKDMISGYTNGTFKPNQGITRQDAAKLLALVLELDTDNVQDPGFKDVSKTNPYYKYIAALVEIGVISGYADNTFKPEGNLSRGQMSKIIVLGFELKDVGAIQLPFKDINDRQEFAGYVRALYANEITTGTTATTFSPNVLVTRGQMASFVFRSEAKAVPKRPTQSELDKTAVEAAANALIAGTVTVSRGNSAPDANKLAAVQTYVTSLITEKDVNVTVAASTTAGNYVVTLTKGEAKVEKLIAITFNNAADDRFVTEVTAANAKQVVVKFATPVTKISVLNSSNEVQNITFTAVSGATVNPGQLKGSLSEDGKTLTITANWIFDGEYAFKSTDAIQAVAGGKYEEYTAIVKANDKVAPKLLSGSAVAKVSTNTFAVFFDEPVSATGAIAYVDDIVATVVNNPTDPNRLDVTTSRQVPAGATARIKMLNVKDYNQNLLAPNPSETTVTISADTVAPIVTQVNILGENKVEVVYDKNMDLASFKGKARFVYSTNSVDLTATAGANAKTVILTGTGSPSVNNYNAVLFIEADVKDTVGNSTALYSSALTLSKDTISPVVTSVEYKDGKIIANFSEDIVASNNTVVTVIPKTGNATTIHLNYYSSKNAVINNQSLIITQPLSNGDYELRLPANTVIDKAGIPNPNSIVMQPFIVQNSNSSDQASPVVVGITNTPPVNGVAPNTDQTATYTVVDTGSGVNLDTVKNLNNYRWNDKELPLGSYVVPKVAGPTDRATSVEVTVYVPTSGITETKTAPFTVNNIQDNAGNTMVSPQSGDVTFVNSYYNQNYNRPELTSAIIGTEWVSGANETYIELGFSEAIQAKTLEAFDLEIRLNNYLLKTSSIASITSSKTNRDRYDVKIQASVADNVYYRGEYRDIVYVDVDDSGKYDDRDLILAVLNSSYYDSRHEKNPVIVDLDSRDITSIKVKLIRDNRSPVVNFRGDVEAVFDTEKDVRLR